MHKTSNSNKLPDKNKGFKTVKGSGSSLTDQVTNDNHNYRHILDETPNLIWKSDADANFRYFNKSWLDFTGRSLKQELGNCWLEGIHPDDLDGWKTEFYEAFCLRESFKSKFRLRRWDGRYHWVVCAAKPSFHPNGKFTGYVGTCYDLDQLKQLNKWLSNKITDEKKLIPEDSDSEQKFRFLFHNAYDAIVVTKLGNTPGEARFLEVNDTACQRYGYTREQFLNLRVKDVLTEQSLHTLKIRRRQFVRDGSATNELDYRSESGTIIPHEVASILIRQNGQPAVISIARDISERKKVEAALRDTSNKLNAVIQASPLAIIVIDTQGTVTSWNKSAENVFGWTQEEIIGRTYPIIPTEHKEEYDRLLTMTLTGQSLVGEEGRRKRKDGRIIDVSICTACLHESNGSINGILIMIEDISDRKMAREALAEVQRQQKAILDNIPDLVWLKDTEGRFIIVNEAAALSHGVSSNDLVGKSDFDISPSDLAQKYRDDDLKVIRSQKRHYTVEPLIDSLGNKIWIETIKTPVFDVIGSVIGTTGIARDITERVLSEKEITESRQKAEKAFRIASLGAMAAGIAHEINQPLNSIRVITDGALFWQKKGKEISVDNALSKFGKISAEVERINEIITNMRSLIHKNQDSTVGEFNLNDTVREALNLLESQLKSRGILVKTNFTEPMPMLTGRKSSLNEVVINLLMNAVQAFEGTEKEEREICCTTKIEEDVILEISDSASGIREEDLDKVLDPFFSTKQGKGMGLGLFIAHTIVTNFGGKLDIKENVSGGVTVRLEFPNLTGNKAAVEDQINENNGCR